MAISVVIIDDHSIVREGVRMILENDPGIEVTGEAAGIDEALSIIRAAPPDIILLDLNLERESSLDRMGDIAEASPHSHIVILTGIVDEEANKRAVAGGADGLVLKSQAAESLLMAVKKVYAGEVWYDRSFTARIIREANDRQSAGNDGLKRMQSLTAREREIVELIADGLVNKEIAQRLSINEKTVRNALTVIYSKLGVTNRLELAIFASKHPLTN